MPRACRGARAAKREFQALADFRCFIGSLQNAAVSPLKSRLLEAIEKNRVGGCNKAAEYREIGQHCVGIDNGRVRAGWRSWKIAVLGGRASGRLAYYFAIERHFQVGIGSTDRAACLEMQIDRVRGHFEGVVDIVALGRALIAQGNTVGQRNWWCGCRGVSVSPV